MHTDCFKRGVTSVGPPVSSAAKLTHKQKSVLISEDSEGHSTPPGFNCTLWGV